METWAFEPLYQRTGPAGSPAGTFQPSLTIAASTTAAAGTLHRTYGSGQQVQIANQTANWAYANFGVAGAVTAATAASSYPIAPGAVVVVTVDSEVTGVSVILGGGTGNVTFTCGVGT